jgi:hypothetical protein
MPRHVEGPTDLVGDRDTRHYRHSVRVVDCRAEAALDLCRRYPVMPRVWRSEFEGGIPASLLKPQLNLH